MYKEASRQKLRFQTSKGLIPTEQLWDIKDLNELDTLAVKLQEECEAAKGKSFLATKSKEDKTIKLKFDIVLDVLTTKLEEAAAQRERASVKEHNEKIYDLIAKKKDEKLMSASLEELEAMVKK